MTHRFCAVDVEGDAGKRGIIGAAIYSDAMQEWLTAPPQIRSALLQHAQADYTFVCHNADYDVAVLWHQLGEDVSVHRFGRDFHCGYWKYDRRRPAAHIWCSLSLSSGQSLESLGDSLALPKLAAPGRLRDSRGDRYAWQCDRHGNWECIECYALRDAEIVHTYMGLLGGLTAGWGVKLGPSLAGIAERAWIALDTPAPCSLPSRKIEKLARDAYVGGRVECYKLGHMGPLWTADVRSAYLSVMAQTPYPDPRDLHYWTHVPVNRIPWQGEGVLQGLVSVPPSHVPPLPALVGRERMYPVGSFRGTWTLHELRYAQSVGCRVLECDSLVWSPSRLYPCSQFTSIMLAGRADAEAHHSPMAVVFKLLGNALYGRWGMAETTERTIIKPSHPQMTVGEMIGRTWQRQGDRYLWRQTDELAVKGTHQNVMWAAQTTSALRVLMHQHLLNQGEALAYSDTDSIFSTAPIEGADHGPGNLEAEGVYEHAIISGPKLYALQHYASDMPDSWHESGCGPHGRRRCDECRWHGRAKGVPRDRAVSFLRSGVAEFSRPTTLSQSARSGLRAGEWHTVRLERHHAPYRRHPTDAAALLLYEGQSPTQPPVIP